MKNYRQLVSFVLGVAVGFCLYSILRLRPLSPVRLAGGASPMSASHPANSLRPPWVQRSLPSQVTAPNRQSFAKHAQVIFPNRAEAQPLLRPKTPALPSGVAAPAAMVLVPDGGAKTAASPAPPTEVAAVKVSTPPAAPPPAHGF